MQYLFMGIFYYKWNKYHKYGIFIKKVISWTPKYRQWIMNMNHDKTCRTPCFEQLQTDAISIDIQYNSRQIGACRVSFLSHFSLISWPHKFSVLIAFSIKIFGFHRHFIILFCIFTKQTNINKDDVIIPNCDWRVMTGILVLCSNDSGRLVCDYYSDVTWTS